MLNRCKRLTQAFKRIPCPFKQISKSATQLDEVSKQIGQNVKWLYRIFLTESYNHGQKCWDSYTVRTLFNTREIVAACY